MAKKITYLNKVDTNEAVGNVVEWWRGSDANEVKDVVNSLAVEVEGLTINLRLTPTEQEVQDKIRELSADKTYVDLKVTELNTKIDNQSGWKSQQKQSQEVIVWSSLDDVADPATESWSVTFNDLGILYGKAEVLTSKSKDDTYKERELMPKEAIEELVDNTGGHSVFNVTKIQQTDGKMRSTVDINTRYDKTANVYTLVGDERNANGINVTLQYHGTFELRKVNNVWNDITITVKWSSISGGIAAASSYRENQYETTFIISVGNNILKITEGIEVILGQDVSRPYGYPGDYGKSVKFTSLEFITDADSTEYTLVNSVDIVAPSDTAGDDDAKSDVRIIEIDNIITPKYPKGQTQEVGGGEVILPDYGYSFVNLEVTWESPAQNQSIVETDLMAKGTDGTEFIISSQSTPLSNRNGAIIKSNMNYTIVNGVDVASLFLRFKLIEGDWPKLSGIKIGHITK